MSPWSWPHFFVCSSQCVEANCARLRRASQARFSEAQQQPAWSVDGIHPHTDVWWHLQNSHGQAPRLLDQTHRYSFTAKGVNGSMTCLRMEVVRCAVGCPYPGSAGKGLSPAV